jgi:hypothetical protein
MFAWRLDGYDGQRIRLLASSDGTLSLCAWIYGLCGERSREGDYYWCERMWKCR